MTKEKDDIYFYLTNLSICNTYIAVKLGSMTLAFTTVITLLQEREREKKSSDVEATLLYDISWG